MPLRPAGCIGMMPIGRSGPEQRTYTAVAGYFRMGGAGWDGSRLVLLAVGVTGSPRGAWFEPAHAAELVNVARGGGLHLVQADARELMELDPDLPAGHLVGPGQTTPLPPLSHGTFDRLTALPGVVAEPRPEMLSAAISSPAPAAPTRLHVPRQTVRVGSTVLASVDAEDGWWEAVVVAITPEEMLRLRWRDFPGLDLFSRPLAQVAMAPMGAPR